MTDEAIRQIAKMARSEAPIVHAPDYGRTGRYYVRQPDGGLLPADHPTAPPLYPIANTAHATTTSLVRRVASDMQVDINRDATHLDGIYFDPEQIVAHLHTTDHRWTHRMDLPWHPVYLEVRALSKPRTFTQRDLIHWLRSTMNGHVPDPDVEQFRALRVASDGTTDTIVAKGHEGVDRRIQATIRQQNGTGVPDTLTVAVPVYDLEETVGDVHPVDVLVDVRAGDSGPEFVLTAVHDGLRRAQRDAADGMLHRLHLAITDHGDDMVDESDVYAGGVLG